MMAILDGNKYSLPYSNACKLIRTVGPYKVYRLKHKGAVLFAVMRGSKVVYFESTLSEALKYLGVDNAKKEEL